MSDDLIRRSDAIEAIEVVDWYHQNRNKDMVSGANSDEHQAWYKAEDVYKALEEVPSADKPQGEWVVYEGGWKDLDYYPPKCKCNQCGYEEELYILNAKPTNFCPNCGADMREREGE